MKSKVILFSVLSLLLISACQNTIYSEREKSLFINPVFANDISLDTIHTLQDLIVAFDKIYCEDKSADKWPVLYFDLEQKKLVNPKAGKNIIALGIEPSPCPDIMFEYDYSRILEVVKDGYNLEVEEQRIEPDSLTAFVSKQYLNFGKDPMYSPDPRSNGIWLITNKDDKLSNLNEYIAQLIDGYVIMARQYSIVYYKKTLDELNDSEYQELKTTLAFHLSFKFSDEPPQIINSLM